MTTAQPAPSSHSAGAAGAAAPAVPYGRSKLVTWASGIFGFLQAVAILGDVLTFIFAIVHINSLAVFWIGDCFDHLALLPLVLAIIALMLAKSHRFAPAVKKLSWVIILHYLAKVVLVTVQGIALTICFLMAGFNLLHSKDLVNDLVKAQAKAITDHPILFLAIGAAMGLMEISFTILWLRARRDLRAGHFVPPPPEPPAPPTTATTAATAATPVPPAPPR